MSDSMTAPAHAAPETSRPLMAMTLAALGVVYGDIGTSPLYALKEIFNPQRGLALDAANLIGALSLIFWSLMFVVSLKYVMLILRADNRGEGGIMALLALAMRAVGERPALRRLLALLGVFGAALFYGDAVLTPAISVLSAIEGLEVATPVFTPYIVPLTVAVILILFLFQSRGTAGIGAVFGPVMVIWFVCLTGTGAVAIAQNPQVLAALNPAHALEFLIRHGFVGFASLGAVVLALTGAEALYADMGHFGAKPIRTAWFWLVLPALAVNYLGQGALLMGNPEAIDNPFYKLFPAWALLPGVGLATIATVIASQATISGAYSMTQQSIQLGFLPRMRVLHTSDREIGQIYVPYVNALMLVVIIAIVLAFGSSSRLANAYGIAVTGTMMITTLLTFFVIRFQWKLPLALCLVATTLFLIVDAAFFGANLLKLHEGGWFPMAIGLMVFSLMTTWKRGREMVAEKMSAKGLNLTSFLDSLMHDPPHRVSGTAVFLVPDAQTVPNALLHNLLHNQVLHERIVFLTVRIEDVPRVAPAQRVQHEDLRADMHRITLHFGFKEEIDVPAALAQAGIPGLDFVPMQTSYFLGRETILPTPGDGMALWRERLFAMLARNAGGAADYFRLPANRVIELGTQLEI
jgi:KUP system potassium uptake protein